MVIDAIRVVMLLTAAALLLYVAAINGPIDNEEDEE